MKRDTFTANKAMPPRFYGQKGDDVTNKETGEAWGLHSLKQDGWIIGRGGSFKFATFAELTKFFTEPKNPYEN